MTTAAWHNFAQLGTRTCVLLGSLSPAQLGSLSLAQLGSRTWYSLAQPSDPKFLPLSGVAGPSISPPAPFAPAPALSSSFELLHRPVQSNYITALCAGRCFYSGSISVSVFGCKYALCFLCLVRTIDRYPAHLSL